VKLKDTVALITGGAKRVGRAIAIELAQAGCDVAIHYHHSKAEAIELSDIIKKSGRRAVVVHGQLSNPKHWPKIIDQTVKSLGRLDVLVNNASIFITDTPDTINDFDHELWEKMLRINLIAPAGLCHYALTYLQANGGGRVINLCDTAAKKPWPKHLAYCASKAGITNLTKSLALAMAPLVQVNGVAPGIAVFPDEFDDELCKKLIDRVPMKRAGTPEEVAHLVRFLVESGDYMTGQIIPIDGGTSM